jgi:hypothetical protein
LGAGVCAWPGSAASRERAILGAGALGAHFGVGEHAQKAFRHPFQHLKTERRVALHFRDQRAAVDRQQPAVDIGDHVVGRGRIFDQAGLAEGLAAPDQHDHALGAVGQPQRNANLALNTICRSRRVSPLCTSSSPLR